MAVFEALLSRFRRDFVTAVFTIHADESYTQHVSPYVFCVAGYIAYAHHWAGFDAEWREALRPYGLKRFHMADYEEKRSPYQDGPHRAGFEALFRGLCDIINGHEIQPFVAFQQFDGQVDRDRIAGMYGNLFRLAIGATVTTYGTIGNRDDDRYQFLFDRISDKKLKRNCLDWFDESREVEAWGNKLLTVDWFNCEDVEPIQAADILAFDMMRNARMELLGAKGTRFSTDKLREKRDIHRWELRWEPSGTTSTEHGPRA